jgi:hypothetical protein
MEDSAMMHKMINAHMKIVPDRYKRDFESIDELMFHCEVLNQSRVKSDGGFAVKVYQHKSSFLDDDFDDFQNDDELEEEFEGYERDDAASFEQSIGGENIEQKQTKREITEPQSPSSKNYISTTFRNLTGSVVRRRWSSPTVRAISGRDQQISNENAQKQKQKKGDQTSSIGGGALSFIARNLTTDVAKISPDSVLNNNNNNNIKNFRSRFYSSKQQQNTNIMRVVDVTSIGGAHFGNSTSSSSVYSEDSAELDAFQPGAGRYNNNNSNDDDDDNDNDNNNPTTTTLFGTEQTFYSMAVACKNRPRVLSEISTAVNDCGLDVHEAHIYNLKDGYVLDVFTVQGWKKDDANGLAHAMMKILTAGIVPERRGFGGSPFPSKTDVNKVCRELDSCEIYDIDPESADRQGWESQSDDDLEEDPLRVSMQMSDGEENNLNTRNNNNNNNNNNSPLSNRSGEDKISDSLNRNQISAISSTKSLENDVMEAMEKSRKANKEPAIDSKKLRIIREIGSGSFGVLYKGEYRGKKVAAKFPSGTHNDNQNQLRAMREFFQELSVLSKVKHENIVRIVGAMTRMPRLCIVTEYVNNGPLDIFLRSQGANLKLTGQVEIACGISRGMAYLHSKNFVHRDLKASNVLLQSVPTPNGVEGGGSVTTIFSNNTRSAALRPVICDFGLSREVPEDRTMTPETGTYRWMAPEVIAHSKYSVSADVYSFAIVLWEIACEGHVPYPEHTPLQAAVAVVQKGIRPILPYNSHPIMLNAMERCWVSEPENRPRFTDLVMDFESHILGSVTKMNLVPSKSFFTRLKTMSTSKKRERI